MPDLTLKQRNWGPLFIGIFLFLLVQVIWWTFIFVHNVDQIKDLRIKNHALETELGRAQPISPETFDKDVTRRHIMFFSESGFFLIVASIGFWLLFRAIKIEDKSRESQRNFIEVISHESKTPLTALKLRMESLLDKSKAQESLSRELSMSLEEVRRLSSILEKALQLNRMENYAFAFEDLSLSDTVKEVLKRMDPLFKEKKIEIITDLEPEVFVKGDRFGMENAIQGILENSAVYNDSEKKTLNVSLKAFEGIAHLNVWDNGPGIGGKDTERIFDRFYRGKAGKKVPGTGLGLYLAKGVISAHQGTLKLVKNESRGAHFEILLPKDVERD